MKEFWRNLLDTMASELGVRVAKIIIIGLSGAVINFIMHHIAPDNHRYEYIITLLTTSIAGALDTKKKL